MKRKDVLRQGIFNLGTPPGNTKPLTTKTRTTIRTNTITQHDANNPLIGTGVFSHNSVEPITYELLLKRLFLQQTHYPSLSTYGRAHRQSVEPHLIIDGNKRTIFANFHDVSKDVKRDRDHVKQYMFSEMGTSGSLDQHERLVIKGRFQQKQIKNIIRRYKDVYVICPSCKSTDTTLSKTEKRTMLVKCKVCETETSAPNIKTGFICMVGKRSKQKQEPEPEPEPEPENKPEIEMICGPGLHCFTDFVIKSKL